MDALVGRYGRLTLEQTCYLRALATAWTMAPDGSWAERRLWDVVATESGRYGVRTDEVVCLSEEKRIDDEPLPLAETMEQRAAQAADVAAATACELCRERPADTSFTEPGGAVVLCCVPCRVECMDATGR